jgi:hypothetical protein
VIEPTDEMIAAADRAIDEQLGYLHRPQAEVLRVIIAAVLAIVERDRCMEPRGHVWHPLRREWPSGRGGKHPHYCVSCSDGEAAGPGCGNCRSTGYDQTPWPNCVGCKADAEQNREMRQSMNADGEL